MTFWRVCSSVGLPRPIWRSLRPVIQKQNSLWLCWSTKRENDVEKEERLRADSQCGCWSGENVSSCCLIMGSPSGVESETSSISLVDGLGLILVCKTNNEAWGFNMLSSLTNSHSLTQTHTHTQSVLIICLWVYL